MLQIFKGGVIRAISTTFIFGGARLLIVYVIVLPLVLSGKPLTPKGVITALSLINVIRVVFLIYVVRCFYVVYEAYVAIVRIQVNSGTSAFFMKRVLTLTTLLHVEFCI